MTVAVGIKNILLYPYHSNFFLKLQILKKNPSRTLFSLSFKLNRGLSSYSSTKDNCGNTNRRDIGIYRRTMSSESDSSPSTFKSSPPVKQAIALSIRANSSSSTNRPIDLPSVLTWTQYTIENKLKLEATSPGHEKPFKVDTEINDKVSLWQGDITKLKIDAIVNAANKNLWPGGGVCGSIFKAAGIKLEDECEKLNGCPEGSSKITKGYNLPAKHVIHTVGPQGEYPEVLKSAYKSALYLLLENNLRSIAFPCISTGIYGYPQEEAAHVALVRVRQFMDTNKNKVDRIIFATFLPTDLKIYEELMQKYFPTEE